MSNIAGQRLLSFIERIERLEQEKSCLLQDIAEVKKEAKGCGFDVKTINRIVKERRQTQEQIQEEQALLELYRAALGMLHDTPLGEAARRQISKPQEEHAPPPPVFSEEDIKTAREEGTAAANSGVPITENPYPARDPRRAAWDEAWCATLGSDGMEIPEAFRRKKPKDNKEDKGGKK